MATFESQHKAARVLVVSPNVQNAYGTALLDAALTHRPRVPSDVFVDEGQSYITDEEQYNKGHDYPTVRQEVERSSSFQLSAPLFDFMAGWYHMLILQTVASTGAGPYTHVFKPENATRQAKATTIYMEDTAAIKTKYPDMVATELTISGDASGAVQAQISLAGSGKWTDGAMGAVPAPVAAPTLLLGSDADVLIGPQAAPVSVKQYMRRWSYTISREIELMRVPGGGLVVAQPNVGKLRAKYSIMLRAKDTEVAGDPRTIALANTIREIQININSGAAAQLKVKFPGAYVRAKRTMEGNYVAWSIEGNEQDVQKSGANEIIECTVINSQATYLVGA